MVENCSCEGFIKTWFYGRVKTWRKEHNCNPKQDMIVSEGTSDTTVAIGFTMNSPAWDEEGDNNE